MFETIIITDDQLFAELESDWQELLLRTEASIFQSWPWCWHWWQLNKSGKRLAIVTVKAEGELVGLLPVFISRSYLGLPLRVGALLGTGTFDYGGVLIDSKSDVPAIMEQMIDCLMAQKWHVLDFHQLPAGGQLAAWEAMLNNRAQAELIDQEATLISFLPADVDGLRSSLGKKFRTNLDYNQRRLEKEHALEVRLSPPDEVARDIDVFFDLHQKRWRNKHLPGAFYSRKNREFHRRVAGSLSESGNLCLSFLLIDDQKVATVYGFRLRDVFYYYLGGFDPAWSSRSVSSLLLYTLNTRAIAEGVRVFDFLRGDEGYKSRWQALPALNYRLLVTRPALRSSLAKWLLVRENQVLLKAKARLHS